MPALSNLALAHLWEGKGSSYSEDFQSAERQVNIFLILPGDLMKMCSGIAGNDTQPLSPGKFS